MKPLFLIAFLAATLWAAGQEIEELERRLNSLETSDSVRVRLLNQLGFEYWIVNPIQSIIYGQQAKALALVIDDQAGLAFSNRVIGVANWAKGSYDAALVYLFEGLEQYRAMRDSLGEANCLMNIGLVYADRSDDVRALDFYYRALELFSVLGEEGRSATTNTKIASILIDQNKLAAADSFLRTSLRIHEASDFEYGQMEVYNRLGLLKFAYNSFDSALVFLNRSLEISKEINDVDGRAKTLIDLSAVYLKRDQLSRAENHLQEALVDAREIGSHKWLYEIFAQLQIVNRRKGNLEQAIFFYDQYIQERDSILNEETISNLSRLEAQLATVEQQRQIEAKEKQIVILEQQSQLQQSRIVFLAILIVVFGAAGFFYIRNRQAKVKRAEEQARAVEEEAQREIESKNRELSSYTVNFVQKNRLFEDLIESIQEIKGRSSKEFRSELAGIEKIVKRHIKVDQDWEDFKLRFENVHSGFFDRLHQKFPSLTNNDLRLSVLVKMNFSIKEIGEMFGISPESVKTARYRLKKKLKLPAEQNLNDFLNEIS